MHNSQKLKIETPSSPLFVAFVVVMKLTHVSFTIHDVQTNTLMIYAPTATRKAIHALVIILLSHPNTWHYMLVYVDNKAIHALINTLVFYPTTGH